jgi:threonine 3-dehydrogenase
LPREANGRPRCVLRGDKITPMKAWVYRKEKADERGSHVFQEKFTDPKPGPSQVLVRVEKVSVCATDESLFRGDLKKVPDGIIPGHEFYGEIVELGTGVTRLKVGQKIAGESHYTTDNALEAGIIGLWGPEIRKGELLPPIHGAYAEYLSIPAECAHTVPAELISDQFWPSLFEAIGNDYYLIKQVKKAGAENLGVFGSGPHGMFAQIFARYMQIGSIIAFETDPYRRNFACQLKAADRVIDPSDRLTGQVRELTQGKWFDATIDMVGKQGQGFASCCETTRDGGTIYLFGLFSGDRFSIDGIPGNEIIFKMKTLSHEYKGKKLKVVGITGREGIWRELIDTVAEDKGLQHSLMKPVTVLGNLDRLGEDTSFPKAEVLKRAYHRF